MRIFISDTNIFIFVAKRDAEGVVPYKEKVNFMGLGKLYQTDKLCFFSNKNVFSPTRDILLCRGQPFILTPQNKAILTEQLLFL